MAGVHKSAALGVCILHMQGPSTPMQAEESQDVSASSAPVNHAMNMKTAAAAALQSRHMQYLLHLKPADLLACSVMKAHADLGGHNVPAQQPGTNAAKLLMNPVGEQTCARPSLPP